ncbi:MAG: GDP-L-fucose synthase [Myxococcota bacterium]|nr:GDP-L-fucose synthase [Myxococcota bacterium]
MPRSLSQKRILVTGGSGFLGSFVVELLEQAGAVVHVPRSNDFDLCEAAQAEALVQKIQPQMVVHCAVDGGGIGYMRSHPGRIVHRNLLMNTHLLHAAYQSQAEVFLGVSSVCAYPRDAQMPLREDALFAGYPEPSNAGYGLTKRMMMEMGRAYAQEYGFQALFPMPVNLYGPRDDFSEERSHVVPALIRRFIEAEAQGREEVVVWGSGRATRELLYVEDCAEAIVAMLQRGEGVEPVNIGTGVETSIRELAEAVARACGYSGRLVFDASKPEGQPRKCLDTSRARRLLEWKAQVDLEEGLKRTVSWFRSQQSS